MYPIKQSTAITVPFFVHDVAGDAVLSLSSGAFTKRISKNGAAFAAMTVTITELENGWYSIPLSTAHSNTTGLLTIVFTHGSAKQVNLQFRVDIRLPDDLATPTNITTATGITLAAVTHTGAVIPTVTTLTGHTAQTGDSFARIGAAGASLTNIDLPNQTMDISGNITGNLTGSVGSVTAAVTVGTLNSNVITAASIAAAAMNGKGDWNIGKTGYSVNALGANTITAASINANAFTAVKFAAASLNGKGDWNIGKTGYSLSQAFPSNFADLSIDVTTGRVDIGSWVGAAPNALIAGRVDSRPGSLAANVITAGSIATAALNGKGDWTVGDVVLTAAGVDDIWDELMAGHTTADTSGLVMNDWQNGGRLDLLLDDIPTTTEFNARTLVSASYFDPAADTVTNVTNVTAAVTVGTINTDAISAASLSTGAIDKMFTTQLTEAYAADNVDPTIAQALFLIQQNVQEFSITGTVLTVKQIDGSTTAATYTLDSASDPTSRTRAT